MTPVLSKNRKKETEMLKNIFAAAAMAAIAYAVVPANAAGGGCSGANLTKTATMIDAMADGEGKIMAQKEVPWLRTRCSAARWVRAACI